MKNKLIFIVLVAFSLSVKAQIYTPGKVIEGTSINNNVGIGTSNAVAKLTIQAGPDGYPTPLKAISIWGPNSPANANSAQDLSWDFAAAGSALIRSYRGSGYDTYMQFMTNSQYTGANVPQVRMHISENGNVGIGTANPQQKFVVSNDGAEGFELYLGQPSGIVGLQSYNRSLNVYSKMQLDASQFLFMNGNVGIGTTNPTSKLETVNTLAGITSFKSIGTSGYLLIDNVGSGENYFSANKFHEFQINGVPKMRINSEGNVGIGTVNPLNKLDVNGTIHSKEVKVDMLGWSDFVFKKQYNLPTLEEVEKHIAEKGHLENIPSEEEVLKNGINLGEMNAKLLQKIEELTLYMIEMKKENTELKNRQLQFEKTISILTNKM